MHVTIPDLRANRRGSTERELIASCRTGLGRPVKDDLDLCTEDVAVSNLSRIHHVYLCWRTSTSRDRRVRKSNLRLHAKRTKLTTLLLPPSPARPDTHPHLISKGFRMCTPPSPSPPPSPPHPSSASAAGPSSSKPKDEPTISLPILRTSLYLSPLPSLSFSRLRTS